MKLFHKMADSAVPVHVIKLIINWYANIVSVVRWGGRYPSQFITRSGVRQGGVLFNMYVDRLIESLEASDLGCHFYGVYVGCLLYAEDIILLSASVVNLQKMLDICYTNGCLLDIIFNAKKSSLFLVGNSHSMFSNGLTYIGGDNISWCEKLKYLGIMFKSGKHLMCEFDLCIRRFYTAANSIYANTRFASEMSKLQLIESFCLPSCFLMDVKYCILVHSNLVNCMLAGIMPTEKCLR